MNLRVLLVALVPFLFTISTQGADPPKPQAFTGTYRTTDPGNTALVMAPALTVDADCKWIVFKDGVDVTAAQQPKKAILALPKIVAGNYIVLCTLPDGTKVADSFAIGAASQAAPAPKSTGTSGADPKPAAGDSTFVDNIIENKYKLHLIDSKYHVHVLALAQFLETVSAATTDDQIKAGWNTATEISEYERIRSLIKPDYLGRSAIPAGFDVASAWSKAYQDFASTAKSASGGVSAFAKTLAQALRDEDTKHEQMLDAMAEHMVRTGTTIVPQNSTGTTTPMGFAPGKSCSCRRQWRQLVR